MAAGSPNLFKLEKDLSLEEMVKGVEQMLPVGMRTFNFIEPDGVDESGEKKYKPTDLSSLQDEIHKKDPNWNWEKGCFDEAN